MKEAVTKFDFESAFKALDEIDIPVTEKGIKANRPALTEIFSRKSKFDALMEEYYDISSPAELEDAQEAREAEVAKAKLERIEKIVDLDADSPEDLLTSYVGKYIIQCPQCMTLFYKDQEDVVESEEDSNVVNVNEICQHCGNDSGYTLIGKVGEAEEGEFTEEEPIATEGELPVEEPVEEEPVEDNSEEENLDDINLDALDLNIEDDEEKKEESFTSHEGEALVEEFADDAELDAKMDAQNEYVEYLRATITEEKEKLEKATNVQVKATIQKNIDALDAELKEAVPNAVKDGTAIAEESIEEPVNEIAEEPAEDEPASEEVEVQEESCEVSVEGETLTEALKEDTKLDVSADEFEELINSPEFKKPISDTEARAMINAEKDAEDESLTEASLLNVGKAIGKKIGQAIKNKTGKISAALDKFVNSAKTREEKADWILDNALENYDNAEFNNDGSVSASGAKKRFKSFIIIGYLDKDVNGKEITAEPAANSQELVPGMKHPQEKTKYSGADTIAKGWSQRQGCGPAYIYLANGVEDNKAVYVCKYFNGKLGADDQLDAIFEKTISDIAGNEAMQQGGMDQSDTKLTAVSELKPGMKIQVNVKGADQIGEVLEVKEASSELGNGYALKIKFNNNGKIFNKTYNTTADFKVNAFKVTATAESLSRPSKLSIIMENVEELQESTLEALISNSLVEAYGNIAGYRLQNCSYLNENLIIEGTIYFTSGNTRKTTYTFTEACASKSKVVLYGLNEKLGAEKQFILTGKIDKINKTLITESFKRNK